MLTKMFANGDPTIMKKIGVEQAIGQIEIPSGTAWPAGTYTVYQKTIDMGLLPSAAGSTTKALDEDYISVLDIYGIAVNTSNIKQCTPIPRAHYNTTYIIDVYINTSGIISCNVNYNYSGYRAYVTVVYFR